MRVIFDANRLVRPNHHAHQQLEADEIVISISWVEAIQIVRFVQNIPRYAGTVGDADLPLEELDPNRRLPIVAHIDRRPNARRQKRRENTNHFGAENF